MLPAENYDALVIGHANLVRRIAGEVSKQIRRAADFEDLMQSGMVGLLEAAQRFDRRLGAQFSTYAFYRIKGAILDAVRRADGRPRALFKRRRSIADARRQIEAVTGAPATALAVSSALGLSLAEYQRAKWDSAIPMYTGKCEVMELIDERDGPAEQVEKMDITRFLAAKVGSLPDVERHIWRLYYEEEWLMREIGDLLELSESRVCQLLKASVERLRCLAHVEGVQMRTAPRDIC